MQKQNYQRIMEETLAHLVPRADGSPPVLLLHSCCAPCSSYVLRLLSPYFTIRDLFYNPNISSQEEYIRRREELCRLVREMPLPGEVTVIDGPYEPQRFEEIACGLENAPEGGSRCERCFVLRLEYAAQQAAACGADYFTTTLSISPHKNAALLNEIGLRMGERYGVPYLCSDFKKKEGFKQSIRLSEQYGLYRQDFCGCRFSRRTPNDL